MAKDDRPLVVRLAQVVDMLERHTGMTGVFSVRRSTSGLQGNTYEVRIDLNRDGELLGMAYVFSTAPADKDGLLQAREQHPARMDMDFRRFIEMSIARACQAYSADTSKEG